MAKNKGERYTCEDCGLVVVVESPCGCDDECEIMCCEKPMKQNKGTDKSSSKSTMKPEKKAEKAKTKEKP